MSLPLIHCEYVPQLRELQNFTLKLSLWWQLVRDGNSMSGPCDLLAPKEGWGGTSRGDTLSRRSLYKMSLVHSHMGFVSGIVCTSFELRCARARAFMQIRPGFQLRNVVDRLFWCISGVCMLLLTLSSISNCVGGCVLQISQFNWTYQFLPYDI